MIKIDNDYFHLSGENYSYCFFVENGKLYHSYFGKPLKKTVERKICDRIEPLFEYGEFGRGDFRIPSTVIRTKESLSTDFVYKGYEILKSATKSPFPTLRGEQEVLAITLADSCIEVDLKLYYYVFKDGLVRNVEIINKSKNCVNIDKAMSFCLDLPSEKYHCLSLYGRPNDERNYTREELGFGIKSIESACGVTSHRQNPFVAIMDEDTSEDSGNVYGFNVVYAGNFSIELEKTEFSQVRVNAGENILYGGIEIKPNESFLTPQVVVVYSSQGIGEMSRSFHRLYRKHLLPPNFRDKIRPIVINSWESLIYDINEESIKKLIDSASGLGIDTFVLDDGWFKNRLDDTTSLGDWIEDKKRLPNGLKPIVSYAKENGMNFGIWIEPEGISVNSDLYLAHPDWAIQTKGREGVQIRNQLTLDFSRQEVIDYVFSAIKRLIVQNGITYLKWDMNRYLTDVVSAEKYRKYTLGVYSLYERLTGEFPNLIIEGCASGGGRYEPSTLYYTPLIWNSDNTDAWCRSKIQYSTSLCYPLQTSSNHVSHCPNNQTGRNTPFKSRGAVASLGCLGYELNLSSDCSTKEVSQIPMQIEEYKKDAGLILTGDLYRILNPYEGDEFCEMVVSEDKSSAYFVYMRSLNIPSVAKKRIIKMKGLDKEAKYIIKERNAVYTGEELVNVGIEMNLDHEDFSCEILHLSEVAK